MFNSYVKVRVAFFNPIATWLGRRLLPVRSDDGAGMALLQLVKHGAQGAGSKYRRLRLSLEVQTTLLLYIYILITVVCFFTLLVIIILFGALSIIDLDL